MCRTGRHNVQDASFIGRGWLFARPEFFLEKRHQNTRRIRVAAPAPADLKPPQGLGLGLGLG